MVQPRLPSTPDVIEAGRVLAQLDDLRAIMFMAGFVIVFLLVFTVWREWAMHVERRLMVEERKAIRELAQSFSESAKEVGKALGELGTKIAVLSALTARAESAVASSKQEE